MSLPQKDKERVVELVLIDLRRLFDEISSNYHQLKNRVLGLIAGEVAMVSFIYSHPGIDIHKLTHAEVIFFGAGNLALVLSFASLLWIISTSKWQIPLEIKSSRKLYNRFNSKLDWLEDIKEDYEICIEYCLEKMRIRSAIFNRGIIVLSSGIIIMLVIKFTS